jgi:hypothetical protein
MGGQHEGSGPPHTTHTHESTRRPPPQTHPLKQKIISQSRTGRRARVPAEECSNERSLGGFFDAEVYCISALSGPPKSFADISTSSEEIATTGVACCPLFLTLSHGHSSHPHLPIRSQQSSANMTPAMQSKVIPQNFISLPATPFAPGSGSKIRTHCGLALSSGGHIPLGTRVCQAGGVARTLASHFRIYGVRWSGGRPDGARLHE